MLDDRTCLNADLGPYVGEFVWTAASNRFAWSAYLGGTEPGGDGVPPYAAVARAETLAGLPPRNPCDVTAQVISDPNALMDCAGALLSDDGYAALVYGWTYAYDPATARLPRFSAQARQHGKPVCAVWLPPLLEGPGSAAVDVDPHVAMFRSMDRCFAALAAWTGRTIRPAPPARPVPTLPGLPPGGAVFGEAR